MDLSIIITAHDEGLLLHKTLLSLIASIKQVQSYHLIELLVHLDVGDEPTKEYLSRCRDILDLPRDVVLNIVEGNLHDLGASRNHAIKHALGDFIFFIDADDLISKNFLPKALAAAEADSEKLYHVESILSFGACYELTVNHSALSRDQAAYELCSRNMWPSSVFGKKEIFLAHPYIKTENGYGHEDYVFNTETIAANILHEVLPGTILFYRRKESSLSLQNISNGVVQPPSALFDFDYFKNLPLPARGKTRPNHSAKEIAIGVYKRLRNHKLPNLILTPIATAGKRLTGKKLVLGDGARFINQEFLDLWIDASDIEVQLFPLRSRLEKLPLHIGGNDWEVSRAYHRLSRKVKALPDYVLITPWIRVGGADKVILAYVDALLAINPSANIAIITTMSFKGEWEDRLPKSVSIINFGRVSEKLSDVEKDMLFSRLIVQLRCRRIHNINSEYAYEWFARHLDFVKHHLYVSASIFARAVIPGTKGRGYFDYADPFGTNISSVLKGIYTDNTSIVKRHIYSNGFNKDIVKVHYQPVIPPENPQPKKPFSKHPDKKHILWASRICPAKNPRLLVEIAKKLDGTKYHIDAFGKADEGMKSSIFKGVPNLTYHGAYSSIEEINPSSYDALLYTSVADGLPNVLIEVALYKIPIIASNAGGISDLIKNQETGFLLDELHDPDAYIAAIEQLFGDYEHAERLAQNAYDLVRTRHSMEHFIKQVREDFIAE